MNSGNDQFLYRYRHLQGEHREWTKRILTGSILHFASPPAFNDPFDCRVHFAPSFSKKKLKQEHIERVKQFAPQLNRSQRRAKASADVNAANCSKLLAQMTTGLQSSVDNLGVLSLSATDCNVLLWSHYAAGHTGVCLKFIATPQTPFFGLAQQVTYTANYPDINLLDPRDKQIEAFVLTKAMGWKYEEEWRIIDHDRGSGNRDFPEDLLVEVILGARMPQQDKEAVTEWVSGRKIPIRLSRALVGSGTFSLDIKTCGP